MWVRATTQARVSMENHAVYPPTTVQQKEVYLPSLLHQNQHNRQTKDLIIIVN